MSASPPFAMSWWRAPGLYVSSVVLSLVMVLPGMFRLLRCFPVAEVLFNLIRSIGLLSVTTLCLVTWIIVVLRWISADFYMQSSNCFAKYNSMLFKSPQDSGSQKTPQEIYDASDCKPLLDMDVLKVPTVNDKEQSIADRFVILTGATGFVGRLLLRDLLLHRNDLSLGGVVLLCRSKRGVSAQDRVANLLNDPIYAFLSQADKDKLLHVVESNVTEPNIGLSSQDMNKICNVWNISHVIHCAASVSFTQTLKEAALSNITSSLSLQSLTGRLKHKSARFVHISTAFVHGQLTGSKNSPLPEQLYSLDGYEASDLYRSMLDNERYASEAMNAMSFPNTYTFSKCICEHLLAQEMSVPTIVIRPSIVGPSAQQPYEGWAGNRPTTIVAAACLYMSYQWNLWSFGDYCVPYIPVDVVSRYVIARAFGQTVDKTGVDSKIRAFRDSPSLCSTQVSQLSDSSDSDTDDDTNEMLTHFADTPLNQSKHFTVHTLAWASESPDSAMFSWIDYAAAVSHLGAVMGLFSRLTVYVSTCLTVRLLPWMRLTDTTFGILHHIFVLFPIDTIVFCFGFLRWRPRVIDQLEKLRMFLDLPFLFFRFMNSEYHFESDLIAPDSLDGERYSFSCAVAAQRFTSSIRDRYEKSSRGSKFTVPAEEKDKSVIILGGKALVKWAIYDLWWALAQPRGTFIMRLLCWIFKKILYFFSELVTVDTQSFSPAALLLSAAVQPRVFVAPNYRSFFDVLLINYLLFALPELHIPLPFIFAPSTFERVPFFGWLVAKLSRNGEKSSTLMSLPTIPEKIKKENDDKGLCAEAFVKWSQDNGLCNELEAHSICCIAKSRRKHLIIPIFILYDAAVIAQAKVTVEGEHGNDPNNSSTGFFSWFKRTYFGKVNMGRIHIICADPIEVTGATNDMHVYEIVSEIRLRYESLVSDYHATAG